MIMSDMADNGLMRIKTTTMTMTMTTTTTTTDCSSIGGGGGSGGGNTDDNNRVPSPFFCNHLRRKRAATRKQNS